MCGGGGGTTVVQAPPAPAIPDYAAAATATAAGNKEAAVTAAEANRVNQITPYGNLTYAQTGTSANNNPLWTATQTLSPAEQAKLDANNNLSTSLLGTAQTGLANVNNLLSGNNTRLDESKLAQPGMQGQTVQDALMARLRPELDRQQAGLDNQLANQGITRGSEAWNTAQTQQGQRANDLQLQAGLQGINTGLAARQQGISEQYTAQTRPLDIVNALRTGNQVQNPQFVNVPQQATTAGADLFGAAQAGYNAQMGQYNTALNTQVANANAQNAANSNLSSGLMGLAGAGMQAYMMSDIRLKTDISPVGKLANGLTVYKYRYKAGGPMQIGVMAREVMDVMPEAVGVMPDGMMAVNYGML